MSGAKTAPVFSRLVQDVGRRTEIKRKLEEFRLQSNASTSREKPRPASKPSTAVYSRLDRDAKMRKDLAQKRSMQLEAERKKSPPVQKMNRDKEKELVGRLAEDAKRRLEQQESHLREKEESTVLEAVRLANTHHARRHDPTIQRRLVATSPRTERVEQKPSPTRVFSKEESEKSGVRLMNARSNRRNVPQQAHSTSTINPKQVEELVGRLYSRRSRLGTSLSLQRNPQSSDSNHKSARHTIGKSLIELMFETDKTMQTSISKESIQGQALEDIDDMLLRIKAKAIPEKRVSPQRRGKIELRAKKYLSDWDRTMTAPASDPKPATKSSARPQTALFRHTSPKSPATSPPTSFRRPVKEPPPRSVRGIVLSATTLPTEDKYRTLKNRIMGKGSETMREGTVGSAMQSAVPTPMATYRFWRNAGQ